jgi:polysaccharide export outer membrane protein
MSLLAHGWIGLALCVAAAGCQLQISFVDPSTPPPAHPAAQQPAAPVQQAGVALQDGAPNRLPAPEGMLAPPGSGLIPAAAAPPPSAPAGGTALPAPGPGTTFSSSSMGVAALPTPATVGAEGGTQPQPTGPPPTELAKKSLPPYVIEPPDILLIDTLRMIPKPPYAVQPLDVLLIRVAQPLPNQPIEGTYTVGPDGTVNLGYSYGLVRVGGLTLEEVERAVRTQVGRVLRDPQVAVGLAQFRGVQQARGEHLVRPDGTIALGQYGCVYVAGLTLAQAKVAVERHLSAYVLDPEVTVDVRAYNSKEYFVITNGAGYGEQVFRFPITGSDTVLRAISFIQGLPVVASRKRIWVARPSPAGHPCFQILPVDWKAIVEGGATDTNYQLFPGDRIYVDSDWLIHADNVLAKVLAPVERLLGFTLLTSTTINSFRLNNGNGGGGAAFIAPLR